MKRLVLIVVLFSALITSAENLYVTSNGAGNRTGGDWANAFAGMGGVVWGSGAGQLGAGDTLWMAGGNYGYFVFGAGGNGEASRLYIKRARSTNSECSTALGWNPSFDSQVVFTTGSDTRCINNDYAYGWITFTGQIDEGIKIFLGTVGGNTGFSSNAIYDKGNSNHWEYLYGVGARVYNNHRMFAISPTYPPLRQGAYIGHCKCIGANTFMFIDTTAQVIVEYCLCMDNIYSSDPGGHANLAYVAGGSSSITFRYNTYSNFTDQGIGIWGPGVSDNIYVYGCTFYRALSAPSPGINMGAYVGSPHGTNFYFYNNTFVDMQFAIRGGQDSVNYVDHIFHVRNNLFYNVDPANNNWHLGVHDYNWVGGGAYGSQGEVHGIVAGATDPFISKAGNNFHIISNISSVLPRDKGINLGSPYNIDADAETRGSDGAWDIGYDESNGAAGGGGTPDTNAPVISDIIITNVLTDSAMISWTSSESATNTVAWGPTPAYGNLVTYPGLSTTPSLLVTGLTAGATVYFTVCSKDVSNNQACATLGGGTFVTHTNFANINHIEAEHGTISFGYTTNGGYIQQLSQTSTNGGVATYDVVIPTSTNYQILFSLSATNGGANSFWIVWTNRAVDLNADVFDITNLTTIGGPFALRYADQRGNGTFDAPQYSPKSYFLPAGTNRLQFFNREAACAIDWFAVTNLNVAPTNDITAPTIGNLIITNITATTLTVSFTNDEPAAAIVDFAYTTDFGPYTNDLNLTLSHEFYIDRLLPNTVYYISVRAIDANGNVGISETNQITTLNRIMFRASGVTFGNNVGLRN